MLKSSLKFACFLSFTIYRSTLFTHERDQNEDRILHVNIPFYISSDARQRFVQEKINMYNILSETKKSTK